MTGLTPQQRIYQAAVEAGAAGHCDLEARIDHDAVEAEIRQRERAGQRVDESVREQLRYKHRGSPVMNLDFTRQVLNPYTDQWETRTDENKLRDFTAALEIQARAAAQPMAVWSPGERGGMTPANDLARQIEQATRDRMAAAALRQRVQNAGLPPGSPR